MAVIWELDFYSRPILDENKKKIWELLICDRDRKLEYVRECPAGEVNSSWLALQLEQAMSISGQTPQKVRFFRPSMTNIVTRGCKQAGLTAQASRRVFSLAQWLRERMDSVYPDRPGFQVPDPQPLPLSAGAQQVTAKPLPGALMGERWLMVSLAATELASASDWAMDFGELFDIPPAPDLVIPGLVIISARALPLSAWMSGVDPVFLKFERNLTGDRVQLLLEASADARWILAKLQAPRDRKAIDEGAAFETAKKQAEGLHFMAVQTDPEIQSFAGFWLLKEV